MPWNLDIEKYSYNEIFSDINDFLVEKEIKYVDEYGMNSKC